MRRCRLQRSRRGSAVATHAAILMTCIVFVVSFLSGCESFAPNHHLLSPVKFHAFDTHTHRPHRVGRANTFVQSKPFATRLFAALADVDSMKAGEMRKELESYGISTKSFFEKSEFAEALKKARAEGKKPIDKNGAKAPSSGSSSTSSSTSSSGASSGSSSTSSSTSSSGVSREARLAAEIEKCKAMKVGDLKKELKDLGISTKSFFEKSEFVKALAEARVDGKKKRTGGAGFGGGRQQQEEEEYDPSYRDVVMQKFNFDARDPRMRGQLIDIKLGR